MNNLLADVVGAPVSRWLAVPFAFDGLSPNKTLVETWNEVGATDDVVGVKEPKCAFILLRNESNPVEAFCFPSGLVLLVDCKPTDPEDVHIGLVRH